MALRSVCPAGHRIHEAGGGVHNDRNDRGVVSSLQAIPSQRRPPTPSIRRALEKKQPIDANSDGSRFLEPGRSAVFRTGELQSGHHKQQSSPRIGSTRFARHVSRGSAAAGPPFLCVHSLEHPDARRMSASSRFSLTFSAHSAMIPFHRAELDQAILLLPAGQRHLVDSCPPAQHPPTRSSGCAAAYSEA